MKHGALWMLAVLLTLGLAGCGTGDESPAVSQTPPETPAVLESVEPSPTPSVSAQPAPKPDIVLPPEESPAEEPAEEEVPVNGTTPAVPPETGRNDGYFDNALFVGDSILEGVRLYVATQRTEGTCLGEAKFLATTSGIGVADLVGDRQNGISYRYKGEEKPLEQIVAEIVPERIFLFLGLNDLAAVEPQIDEIVDRYLRLLELLHDACPGAEIIIMTNPPKVASTWLPDYTPNRAFGNELLDSFVEALIGMCEEQGVPYVDIHAALENESGVLPEEYCSDGFVHLNKTGAAAVVSVLYEYADGKA